MAEMGDYRGFLNLLYKSKPAYRKKLLEGAPAPVINLLGRCALNILRGNILLSQQQKNKLRKHKGSLRQIADEKVSKTKKRKVLQKGGFLPAFILPFLGPILGSVAGAVAGRIIK